MLTTKETANALYGLSRLIRLDPDGFTYFNASREGFWNSFWVAAVIGPAYMLQNLAVAAREDMPEFWLSMLLVDVFTYIIGWVLFPLVMIRISDLLDVWPKYFRYMVAYNWFQLVIGLILLPLMLLSAFDAVPLQAMSPFFMVAGMATLVYTWFLARRGLDVSGLTAVGLVILDMLLSALISGITAMLVGGGMMAAS